MYRVICDIWSRTSDTLPVESKKQQYNVASYHMNFPTVESDVDLLTHLGRKAWDRLNHMAQVSWGWIRTAKVPIIPAKSKAMSLLYSSPLLRSNAKISKAWVFPHRCWPLPNGLCQCWDARGDAQWGTRPSRSHDGSQVCLDIGDLQAIRCSGQCAFLHSCPQYWRYSQSTITQGLEHADGYKLAYFVSFSQAEGSLVGAGR